MAIYKITETLNNIKVTGGKCNINWIYDTMMDPIKISVVINGVPCEFVFYSCHGRYILDGVDCDRVKINNDLRSQYVTHAGGGNKHYALYIPSDVMKSAPKENQKDFRFTGQYYSTKPAVKYFKDLLKSLLTEHPEYFIPSFLNEVGLNSSVNESNSIDETINSSEPAYDEIKAMRDEEYERARRRERLLLMHKVFDKHGLVDSDEKWTSDLYDLFYYAEEVRLVSNLNSIPNKTEDGQTIKYRWSVDDINIYTDAYADYVYILEPAQLTEGFRYSGTDKTSEKLTMDALNELEANPGTVYNYTKFDIFYGENKDHFPFKPCYYIKFRPSGYTSIMVSKDHCLKYINDNKLDESVLTEGRLNSSYDKTQLENDLLALTDIDKVDWDLSAYDELGEVIVLTHRAFEDSLDMSTYYMQRTNLLREILKVFDKNNLKLVDPIEDQGTWWYFVLEHKNPIENSDKPKFEYMMVEFFETSGTPADDIMRRTKDVKYTDLSKLNEILVNADKIFRDIDKYGGCNKVYFDNYIRYQNKLYKFHAGRVDIGDGPAEVSIPANYPEQVTNYFLSELNSGNKDIPIVEE